MTCRNVALAVTKERFTNAHERHAVANGEEERIFIGESRFNRLFFATFGQSAVVFV